MKKYSDLELTIMFAELEFKTEYIEYPEYGQGYPYVKHSKYDMAQRFDLLDYKEYLFDLMLKYKVSINRPYYYIEIDCGKFYTKQSFKSSSEIPRAIIECILKSENII